MRLLLDTHAFLWWVLANPRLPASVLNRFTDPSNDLFLSSVSVAEIAIKTRLGKLQLNESLVSLLPRTLGQSTVQELPFRNAHALVLENLPMHHRDPFDRMLMCQAMVDGLNLVTDDAEIKRYAVSIAWL